MLLFWLMWLSLVLGIVVGCFWTMEAGRRPWLKRARVAVRKSAPVPQSETISPVYSVQETGFMPVWRVQTDSGPPRSPTGAGTDSGDRWLRYRAPSPGE
jgi:hypothetical protein